MSDLTSSDLQSRVSDHIGRIRMSGAGEAVRDLSQKELSSINPASGANLDVDYQQSPLASDIHSGMSGHEAINSRNCPRCKSLANVWFEYLRRSAKLSIFIRMLSINSFQFTVSILVFCFDVCGIIIIIICIN